MNHDPESQNLTSLYGNGNQENPATDKKQNKTKNLLIVAVIVIIVVVVVMILICASVVGVLNLKFMYDLKEQVGNSKIVQKGEPIQSDRVEHAASMCMVRMARPPEFSSNGYVTINSYSDNDRNFIREGIKFDRDTGHFHITKDGLYTINSKITVQIYPNEMLKKYKQRIKLLHNKNIPHVLATRKEDTHCNNIISTEPCYFSNLVTTKALKKGDTIFVEATEIAESVGTIVMDGTSSCIEIMRTGS